MVILILVSDVDSRLLIYQFVVLGRTLQCTRVDIYSIALHDQFPVIFCASYFFNPIISNSLSSTSIIFSLINLTPYFQSVN